MEIEQGRWESRMVGAAGLNEAQRRAFLFACLDLHTRMEQMESALLLAARPPGIFTQTTNDLSPLERKVVVDYFTRVREALVSALQSLNVSVSVAPVSLRWSLTTALSFMRVTVDDQGPSTLRGYGELDPAAAEQLVRIQGELHALIARASAFVGKGGGHDLAARIASLKVGAHDAALLAAIERIVTKHGLVELRPRLDELIRKVESPRFEIAVFGRISSGKSSLLNRLVASNILPVGSAPVTSVLTKIMHGEVFKADVVFADRPQETVPADDVRNFVSEERNPGNRRHVAEVRIRVPAERLREGVVLVDTPGVLAYAGVGDDALAYLPRCDHAMVLVEAGAQIGDDERRIFDLLLTARVPFEVVMSKCDIFDSQDELERRRGAMEHDLAERLGWGVRVSTVTTLSNAGFDFDEWSEVHVTSLVTKHQELLQESISQKVARLGEEVVTALRLLTQHGTTPVDVGVLVASLDRLLMRAYGAIRESERAADALTNGRMPVKVRASVAYKVVATLRDDLAAAAAEIMLAAGEPDDLPRFDVRGCPIPADSAAGAGETKPHWNFGERFLRERVSKASDQDAAYDRQLQEWARRSIAALRADFEARTEVARRTKDRAEMPRACAPRDQDSDSLTKDLDALVTAMRPH